jgi:transcriptional regulator with XRE-family HTH domain
VVQRAKSFAERLRALRDAAGLTSYALAKRAGLTLPALRQLELGDSRPSWETVQRLAAALEVSCEDFADPELKRAANEPPRSRGRPPKKKDEP